MTDIAFASAGGRFLYIVLCINPLFICRYSVISTVVYRFKDLSFFIFKLGLCNLAAYKLCVYQQTAYGVIIGQNIYCYLYKQREIELRVMNFRVCVNFRIPTFFQTAYVTHKIISRSKKSIHILYTQKSINEHKGTNEVTERSKTRMNINM